MYGFKPDCDCSRCRAIKDGDAGKLIIFGALYTLALIVLFAFPYIK